MMAWAQVGPETGFSQGIGGLQQTLKTVHDSMMTKVNELTSVGQSLGAFGSLLYVSVRVWGHLARAESVDFFPLLRPFAFAMVLTFYPGFISLVDTVMGPTVVGSAELVTDANVAIANLLAAKQAALEQSQEWQMYVGPDGSGSQEKWEEYSGEASTGAFSGITNAVKFTVSRMMYNFQNSVKVVLSEILQIVYEAAALCINTLRTFNLILLAILGPLAIGISCFDGFKNVFTSWLARYINVFLWLPVANVFGSLCGQIQAEMIKVDIAQIQATGTTSFGETDAAYMIFLIIAIVGYFCVPSITNHIINVFPSGGAALQNKMTGGAGKAPGAAGQVVAASGKALGAAFM
jgi:conjugative transposon TraJ protein